MSGTHLATSFGMLLLLLGACDLLFHDCTLMYAPSQFLLKVDVAAEGAWSWTLDSGDAHVDCTVTLPGGADAECTGDVSRNLDVQANGAGWELLSGIIPPNDADTVVAVVFLDGDEQGSQTFTPDWTVNEPNGEGCGEQISGAGELDLTDVE